MTLKLSKRTGANITVVDFLNKWKVSKVMVARMCGMATSTFFHKASDEWIHFTPEEQEKIKSILKEMANDAEKIAII